MIKIRQKGNFANLTKYLEKNKNGVKLYNLDSYGKAGVKALSSATPVDSGETANSWYYTITNQNGKIKLSFHNSHVESGVSIAIIIQYGHATKNGGWVEGRDYINPAIQPIFDKLAEQAGKEVSSI